MNELSGQTEVLVVGAGPMGVGGCRRTSPIRSDCSIPGAPAYEGESDYYSGSKPSRKRIGCAAGNRPYATSPSCVSSGELAL